MTSTRDRSVRAPATDTVVEQAIDLLYHSTRDPSFLTSALHALRRVLGAARVAYVLPLARICVQADDHAPEANAVDSDLPDAWCTPGRTLMRSPVGVCLHDGVLPGTTASPGVWHVSTKLHDSGSCAVFLCIERARAAAPFGAEALALLERLLPDLARVARLHGDMAPSLPTLADALAVDTLGIAHCVVDVTRAVLQCNRPMQSLLAGAAPIGQQGTRLRMATEHDEARLRQAIADAVAPTPQSTLFHTISADGRRLSVHAVPMRARAKAVGADAGDDQLVLLIVGKPGTTEVTTEALHNLYDMSPAEARAALQVLCGGSGGDMASRLGVSLSTFKTQLQASYAKTGTRRKTELMRLLLAPGLRAN